MRKYFCLAVILATALSVSLLQAQTPTISSGGILNSGALAADPSNVAAPGGLITIFGTNLAPSSATANTSATLPTTLNNTAVQIGSAFAPLAFVSTTQINAQVPFNTTPGATAVTVWVNGRPSAAFPLMVTTAAPGIFTISQNGSGSAVAYHPNSTPITTSAPASVGEQVSILMTGLGQTLASGSTGPVATGAPGAGQPTVQTPSVTVGGVSAPVVSSVADPGQVGLYLVGIIVPSVSASGPQPLAVSVGGATTAAAVTLPVGQSGQFGSGGGTGTSGGGGVAGGPVIFSGGILNAASYTSSPTSATSPGALISIFGNNLATTTTGAAGIPLTTTLATTQVFINNIAAPLLLVSASQINAQVPFQIQPGSTVNLVVTVNGVSSASASVQVAAAAPGIFTVAGSGAGPADLFHSTGALVSAAAPATPGETVTMLVTGMGDTLAAPTLPAAVTGQAAAGQLTVNTPTVTVDGVIATLVSSIATAGAAGEYTIAFVVPNVPAGNQNIVVSAGGNSSQAATIDVSQLFPQPPAFLQLNLAGAFTATFSLNVTVPSPQEASQQVQETVVFSHTIPGQGCTLEVEGSNGPTYNGLLHCQDYTDPNNLMAIIVELTDGQFANNKLVFTTMLTNGLSQFIFDGCAIAVGGAGAPPCTTGAAPNYSWNIPSGAFALSAATPITLAVVSVDLGTPDQPLGPSNFAVGAQVIGTINVSTALPSSSIIPQQTIEIGGGFVDTIQLLQ